MCARELHAVNHNLKNILRAGLLGAYPTCLLYNSGSSVEGNPTEIIIINPNFRIPLISSTPGLPGLIDCHCPARGRVC